MTAAGTAVADLWLAHSPCGSASATFPVFAGTLNSFVGASTEVQFPYVARREDRSTRSKHSDDALEQPVNILGQRTRTWAVLAVGASLTALLTVSAGPGQAASSHSCAGGGYRLVNLATGATVASSAAGEVDRTIAASSLGAAGAKFGVRGRYISFDVRLSDFAVFDYAFTGAANPEDITGGRRTPVYASKIPQHRGRVLSSAVGVELDEEDMVLGRTGTGLSMKIQAKDCAQGGIF